MNQLSAYAKLNLTLKVEGVRDGFHLLESMVVTVSIADEIELLRDDCEPCVEWRAGAVAAGEMPADNNCLRAIRLLAAAAGRRGAAVRVTRNIPDRGGLGGSSAQAAGVIRLLCVQWGISLESETVLGIADAIGSDVRVLLHAGLSRMRGRGEAVERITARPPLHFVVAMSGETSTAEVFRTYDELSSAAEKTALQSDYRFLTSAPNNARTEACDPLTDLHKTDGSENPDARSNCFDASNLRGFGNDLTAAAIVCEPLIRTTLERISATNPIVCGMSGSGAACFGVYASREAAIVAAGKIVAKYVAVCEAIYEN